MAALENAPVKRAAVLFSVISLRTRTSAARFLRCWENDSAVMVRSPWTVTDDCQPANQHAGSQTLSAPPTPLLADLDSHFTHNTAMAMVRFFFFLSCSWLHQLFSAGWTADGANYKHQPSRPTGAAVAFFNVILRRTHHQLCNSRFDRCSALSLWL